MTEVCEVVITAPDPDSLEVPGISARPIVNGNPEYLAWIAAETKTNQTTDEDHQDYRLG